MVGENLTWFFEPKPASNAHIAVVESAIGYRLPDDFREFSKSYSGGSPNETDFEFSDSDTRVFYASVGEFFTLSPEDDRNHVGKMQRTEFFPSGLVPFAGDGGGNYICFDFRSDGIDPAVVFWHHERRGMDNEVSFVAKTFSDFVELLYEPDDEEDFD